MQLSQYIFEIDSTDKATLHQHFFIKQPLLKKIILFIPAVIGFIIHAPVYILIKWLNKILVKEDDHFDSAIVGISFILYPVFILAACFLIFCLTRNWVSFSGILLLPFTAWAYVQLKKQLD